MLASKSRTVDSNDSKKFWTKISKELSVYDFEQLREAMGISPYKFTALQNGTKRFSFEEFKAMCSFLKMEPTTVIEEYGIGLDSLTATQLNELAQSVNKKIAFIVA